MYLIPTTAAMLFFRSRTSDGRRTKFTSNSIWIWKYRFSKVLNPPMVKWWGCGVSKILNNGIRGFVQLGNIWHEITSIPRSSSTRRISLNTTTGDKVWSIVLAHQHKSMLLSDNGRYSPTPLTRWHDLSRWPSRRAKGNSGSSTSFGAILTLSNALSTTGPPISRIRICFNSSSESEVYLHIRSRFSLRTLSVNCLGCELIFHAATSAYWAFLQRSMLTLIYCAHTMFTILFYDKLFSMSKVFLVPALSCRRR